MNAQSLEHLDFAAVFIRNREIGERPADINADAVGHARTRVTTVCWEMRFMLKTRPANALGYCRRCGR